MMEFWGTTWGDVATVFGIVVSLGGLTWAIKEAHGAKSAANATKDQIARHLQAVDLQRAIGLIERIKTLHDNDRWEASREHYQTLREMLSDVIVRCPEDQREVREKLATARANITGMDNLVRERSSGVSESDRSLFGRSLNDIQSGLEELASDLGFGDPRGETK
jgi:Co/Zn/Cd efflux system component